MALFLILLIILLCITGKYIAPNVKGIEGWSSDTEMVQNLGSLFNDKEVKSDKVTTKKIETDEIKIGNLTIKDNLIRAGTDTNILLAEVNGVGMITFRPAGGYPVTIAGDTVIMNKLTCTDELNVGAYRLREKNGILSFDRKYGNDYYKSLMLNPFADSKLWMPRYSRGDSKICGQYFNYKGSVDDACHNKSDWFGSSGYMTDAGGNARDAGPGDEDVSGLKNWSE